MNVISNVLYRLRALLFKGVVERDLDREISYHLEREAEKNVGLGMTPHSARRQARLAFGSVEATKEAHRDGRGTRWLEDFLIDARVALRTLRKNPGFAAAAIITLMLGIGANVAIFTAVNAVLIRPLPYAEPDRLLMLWEENPDRNWVLQTAAPANYLDWRDQVKSFDGIGAYASFNISATLTGAGEPVQLPTVRVTGDFFRVLGVQPAAGRLFEDKETWRTGEQTVVITHRLWRERFAGDASLPGKTIKLNGIDMRVVGVLPPAFTLPGVDVDIWRPFLWDPAQRTQASFRRAHWLRPIARLRDGVAPEQANAELQTVMKRLEQDYPATNTHMGGGLTPLQTFLVGESKRPLLILLGAVGALLLIACANVGNLLLVQAAGRTQETALRLALGARRSRLVRQALTESGVLAVIGGVAGCIFGYWSAQVLSALSPATMLPERDMSINWTVFVYVALVTMVSSVLFGIAPVLWSRGRAPADAMRDGSRSTSGGLRMRRWADALLVSEVALAALLTVGAGLLLKSFRNLERLDAGMNAAGVITAKVSLPGVRYDSVRKVTAFWETLAERTRTIPGVTATGGVSQLPLTTASWSSDFAAKGWPTDRFGTDVLHRDVLPGYFDAMGVRLLRGRPITDEDRFGAQPVVVINDAIAQQFFKGEDPVGQQIAFDRAPDSTATWRTIVGVVASERQGELAVPARPEIFESSAQRVNSALFIVARTRGNPSAVVPALRQALSKLDPNLALSDVRTMEDVRGEAAARERFVTVLLLAFAVVGLILAIVGVYGVMARVARGRSREMGIRIALGARAAEVHWLVVRRGLVLTGAGLLIGLGAAAFVTGVLGKLLYNVEPIDPLTFTVVPLLLLAASIAACWLPAMRASNADPVGALRMD